ncbi:hypothetical protein [Accumulibacter sp.]|uniref:hypothetical protein n=1 Tax=Accumulibacter sp. TaxID=2053492 RepID=UPI0025CB85C5|nr:hypothetical protein [Accumulibacter sp.]MCM8612464.1 hypothetical protein [Accumulibacter sp.]MCM8636861.1 hypothetical protein [Accumulibacter sp.]MCM8640537.1 hypothetical protein [Accumulibacter sp.]
MSALFCLIESLHSATMVLSPATFIVPASARERVNRAATVLSEDFRRARGATSTSSTRFSTTACELGEIGEVGLSTGFPADSQACEIGEVGEIDEYGETAAEDPISPVSQLRELALLLAERPT